MANFLKFFMINMIAIVDFFYILFSKTKSENKLKISQLIKEEIEKKNIYSMYYNEKKIELFCPNYNCYWRYESMFTREPETIEWIEKNNMNNKIFWDIGANIGIFSILTGIRYPKSQTISFEPSTSNLRVLSRNIFLNNLKNISIFPIAISDQNKFDTMSESEFSEGSALHNFDSANFKSFNNYQIFSMNLDYLVTNNLVDIPNYLKIDIDGYEDRVIFNASQILKSENLLSIIIEMSDEIEKKKRILNFMKQHGFRNIKKISLRNPINSKQYNNYILERN